MLAYCSLHHMKLQPTDAAGRARSPRPRPPPAQFLPGVESGRARVWRRLDFGESSLLGMNYSTRDGVCSTHFFRISLSLFFYNSSPMLQHEARDREIRKNARIKRRVTDFFSAREAPHSVEINMFSPRNTKPDRVPTYMGLYFEANRRQGCCGRTTGPYQ